MGDVILEVKNLSVEYQTTRGTVRAVNNVSFQLHQGEALALIGESGCGKTTLSLALIRMLARAARITSGEVLYTRDGTTQDVLKMSRGQLRAFRWQDCAMVFQGALNSLNPVLRISEQFFDTTRAHGLRDRKIVHQKILALLEAVRLDPARVFHAYPHELSGGMRQRVLLAIGVLLNPQVVILDEPTTALDILTQRTVINALKALQRDLAFSYIFISHDLALAAEMADRVATMYAGEIVEQGTVDEIFHRPLHPYTLGLLRAVPRLSWGRSQLSSIPGSPPDLINPPSGCKFHPRCTLATTECRQRSPTLQVYETAHAAACWHTDQVVEARKDLRRAEPTR